MSGQEILQDLGTRYKKDFDTNRQILTFAEYLALLGETPQVQLRGAARYMLDMMDHFGKVEVKTEDTGPEAGDTHPLYHFKVFDESVDGVTPRLVGHESVQTEIYQILKSFVRQKMCNRLILLHGPNGSAKSTITHSLMAGTERYSKLPEGALYTFSWVFPVDKITKGELGLRSGYSKGGEVDSYAKLNDDEVGARIPCDLRDHPFLLIPAEERLTVLRELLGEKLADELWEDLPLSLQTGGLCQRCQMIFSALLSANGGDYKKVLRHICVQRTYLSRRYRTGLSTVEPQMHVDANYSQLTLNKSITSLPPSLQNLNLFTLTGDLIDGNRGVVEYSDLLKRPVDSFKYLLVACETGAVNVGPSLAYVDAVMIGSTNELQLDAFKEFPDFASFKARIELVRVPYLLKVHQEQEIYDLLIPRIVGDKHVAPHSSWILALWSVLTRLKKPNSINYPPSVSTLVSNLSPFSGRRRRCGRTF